LTAADSTGAPFGIAGTGQPTALGFGERSDAKIISDELQLQGKALNETLDYTTGLYYADEKTPLRRVTSFFDIFPPALSPPTVNDNIAKNRTYAVYGQGTYHLTRQLSFTAGARYNTERVEREELPDDAFFSLYDPLQSKTYRNVSWTVGVQEQLDPD
jgi:iron complex outermembrane receptor protein